VSEILNAALVYQNKSHGNLGFDYAVNIAMDTKVVECLQRAGKPDGIESSLLDQLIHVEVQQPGGAISVNGDQIESIVRRLNGLQGITAAQVEQELNKLPPGYHAYASELAAQNSVVYSPRAMAHELRTMHQSILQVAQQRNIPIDNIYYFVPGALKSYGMVAMAYMYATGVGSDRFVSSPQSAPSDGLIIVLDDLAGTGGSLSSLLKTDGSGVLHTALTATIISTSPALEDLPSIPNTVIEPLENSPLARGLPTEHMEMLYFTAGHNGHGGMSLCVSLPYMSPDNNCSFWSTLFAPYFTASSAGIKNKLPYTPPDEQRTRKWVEDKLKKRLTRVNSVLENPFLGVAKEIALARSIDTLMSIAVQFGIQVSDVQAAPQMALHRKLELHCQQIVARAKQAPSENQDVASFTYLAAVVLGLKRAERYLSFVRMSVPPRELLLQVRETFTNLSPRIDTAVRAKLSRIRALCAQSNNCLQLARLSNLLRHLKKVASVAGCNSECLTSIPDVQRALLTRAETILQSEQQLLSEILRSPSDLSVLRLRYLDSLERSLNALQLISCETVAASRRAKTNYAETTLTSRNRALKRIVELWLQLATLEQTLGATTSLSSVANLIEQFQRNSKNARVRPDEFIKKAVKVAGAVTSSIEREAQRALQQEKTAEVSELKDTADRNLRELRSLGLEASRDVRTLIIRGESILYCLTQALQAKGP
jgi:hypothetical protein